jgi:hypothetical protein
METQFLESAILSKFPNETEEYDSDFSEAEILAIQKRLELAKQEYLDGNIIDHKDVLKKLGLL